MLLFLHKFWYNMVSMIAIHLHNNEDIVITDYVNSTDIRIQKYFHYLYDTLKVLIKYYPSWLSENQYIKLGKSLMKILEIYGITYSTDDLSDNFIFKLKE